MKCSLPSVEPPAADLDKVPALAAVAATGHVHEVAGEGKAAAATAGLSKNAVHCTLD